MIDPSQKHQRRKRCGFYDWPSSWRWLSNSLPARQLRLAAEILSTALEDPRQPALLGTLEDSVGQYGTGEYWGQSLARYCYPEEIQQRRCMRAWGPMVAQTLVSAAPRLVSTGCPLV